jgi:hypothetical protein
MATQTYYELLEMMQAEAGVRARHECSVCRLTLAGVDRYLRLISLENVNDFETRQQLRQAGGFCNRHAYAWAKLYDALGTAIIYEDMLREAGRKIERGDFAPRKSGGIFGRRSGGPSGNPFGPCPACEYEDKVEERVISEFAEGFKQAEFRTAYAAPQTAGLCMLHFRCVLSSLDESQVGELTLRQREKLAATQAVLHEIIDKMDASKHPNPADRQIGEEREALTRAIWQMIGLEDIE